VEDVLCTISFYLFERIKSFLKLLRKKLYRIGEITMSWDVYLKDEKGNTFSVPLFKEGGTRLRDGCSKTKLNITYNYSPFYYKYISSQKGLRFLNGKKAKLVKGILAHAVENLGIKGDGAYWKSTKGNAGFALSILLEWVKKYPEGIFEVH